MDAVVLEKYFTITGPWGIIGILIWLLVAEVRHNTELRAEMRSTVDTVRATAAAQIAAFERLAAQLTAHDRRSEEIQHGVQQLLDRPRRVS